LPSHVSAAGERRSSSRRRRLQPIATGCRRRRTQREGRAPCLLRCAARKARPRPLSVLPPTPLQMPFSKRHACRRVPHSCRYFLFPPHARRAMKAALVRRSAAVQRCFWRSTSPPVRLLPAASLQPAHSARESSPRSHACPSAFLPSELAGREVKVQAEVLRKAFSEQQPMEARRCVEAAVAT